VDISPQTVELVLWELRLIRWLLILLLLVGICFVVFLFFAKGVMQQVTSFVKADKNRINQEIEGLLHQGSAKEAFLMATECLAGRAKDPTLHWYIGQAQYQLGKFHDAKRSFQTILDLAPEWNVTVSPWLELIGTKLETAKPRVVE